MKTYRLTINTFIVIAFLLTHAHAWSKIVYDTTTTTSTPIIITKTNHNHENALISLPKDCFNQIIDNSIDLTKTLKETIKFSLNLLTTCKAFYFNEEFPIIIGKACKSYKIDEKDEAMKMLLEKMNCSNYWDKKPAALLLTYAGANNNVSYFSLFERAVSQNDEQMITTLFNNNASPNQKRLYDNHPISFSIKTVDIAKMFFKRGINFNDQHCTLMPNILWACLIYRYSPELIEFYLNHNVDAKCIKELSGKCILHQLGGEPFSQYEINDYIQIGTLLLKAAPDIINTLNKSEQTPLDYTKEAMERFKKIPKIGEICKVLIALFEKHGGKTANELKCNTK